MVKKRINPCVKCPKKNNDLFDNFEYGCDEPCVEANQFFEGFNAAISYAIKRIKELLEDHVEDE